MLRSVKRYRLHHLDLPCPRVFPKAAKPGLMDATHAAVMALARGKYALTRKHQNARSGTSPFLSPFALPCPRVFPKAAKLGLMDATHAAVMVLAR